MKITSRYEALGIPLPDSKTMCKGDCEGIGWYPESNTADNLWRAAHNKGNFIKRLWHKYKCDGWHFVKCPDCNGTGRRGD